MIRKTDLKKIHDDLWEIPKSFRHDMRVPARVYASSKMLDAIFRDHSLEQAVNLTTLPGIQVAALVMPDAHEGYGSPIGGVFAVDAESGVISPGGIGYDINCGVRLLRSSVKWQEVKEKLPELGREIYREVPSGVGVGGRMKLDSAKMDQVLAGGALYLVEQGYGEKADIEHAEAGGRLEGGDPAKVSGHAKGRGRDQLGTMGSGNHFVEVQRVDEIFDEEAAKALGFFKDQVTVLIHTGSRGLGHQIATDYIRVMLRAMPKYGIELPDRELACGPFKSQEGQDYFSAMKCGANFAWANRQLITWEVRKAWERVLGVSGQKLDVVYDVAHNMAKVEKHTLTDADDMQINAEVQRKSALLVVHRKGATRAFPPNHPETPTAYKVVGQPVFIPGSMGTASYVLVGTEQAMKESFGSSCHGSGRLMSRHAAIRAIPVKPLKERLEKAGIVIEAGSLRGLAEEAPEAYKDVEEVVGVVHRAGIAKKVARLRPLAVIKG